MRKVIIAMLALGFCFACAAVKVESVRSVDLSPTSNQVSIALSGSAQYSVQDLAGGNGVRVVIRDVETVNIIPQYPRLSRVIDLINAYSDGTDANIVIRTMGSYNFSHGANSDNSRITVTLGARATGAPKPKPAPAPKSPPPQDITLATTTTEPSLEEPSIEDQEIAIHDSVPPLLKTPLEETPPSQVTAEEPGQGNNLLKYIIPAIALFLCLVVILRYFRRKPEAEVLEIPEEKRVESPLSPDSEILNRMVRKLLAQGWTVAEIAREMRMSTGDVEKVISQSQAEDDDPQT